jgi:hypothetical protein
VHPRSVRTERCAHRLWTTPVDTGDTRSGGRLPSGPGLWTTPARDALRPQTARMSIEMRAAEVHAMAASLRRSSDDAAQIGVRLAGGRCVGGDLQGAIDAFLDVQRTTGAALAGELQWLGATISEVADSWLRLDGSLVVPHGPTRTG